MTRIADTIDELLVVDETEPELAIALGPVFPVDGKHRWRPVITASDLPTRRPGDPTYGELMYRNMNYAAAALAAKHFRIEGWLYSGVSWTAPDPTGEYAGRLAEHPDAEHSATAIYLDQATGAISYRITTKVEINAGTNARPETGWDIDEHGCVPALLDKLRAAAAAPAPNPLFRDHTPRRR